MKTHILVCGAVLCACAAVADNVKGPLLWQLLLEKDAGEGQSPRVVAVEGAGQVARVERAGADVKRYIYESVKKGTDTFNVKVTIEERKTPQGAVYVGTVENNEQGAMLTRFIGPKLPKFSVDPKTASLYIPTGFGRRVNGFPAKGEKPEPWKDAGAFYLLETGTYPSRHFTMPWLALEADGAVWYVGVHDVLAHPKKAGVRWYPGEKAVGDGGHGEVVGVYAFVQLFDLGLDRLVMLPKLRQQLFSQRHLFSSRMYL